MKALLVVNENPISVDLVRGVLSLDDAETLHVRILFPLVLNGFCEDGGIRQLDLEWLMNRAEGVAEKVADVLQAQRADTEVVVRRGKEAVDIIIREANSFHPDWIVLGQRLDGPVEDCLIDTTVQGVSNLAPCPVKVVPLESWHGRISDLEDRRPLLRRLNM